MNAGNACGRAVLPGGEEMVQKVAKSADSFGCHNGGSVLLASGRQLPGRGGLALGTRS